MSSETGTEQVLHEVGTERARQDAKWGLQSHDALEWLSILGEEFGEVCRAAYEAHFHGGSWQDYREECIQVAAVAAVTPALAPERSAGASVVECFDRVGPAPAGDKVTR